MSNNNKKKLILVSGPSKSGKSRFAESLIKDSSNVTYLATSNYDENTLSWLKRLEKHKKRRPKEWNLIESADLVDCLDRLPINSSVLVDSLGGIVGMNISLECNKWEIVHKSLLDKVNNFKGTIIIVVEETGWGVCPETKIGNLFRDRLGSLADELDQYSTDSWLVLHGRAINIFTNSIRV